MAEKTDKKIRYCISVKGIVQGVGFRPFVYNTANKFNLKGFVLNDSNGVEIEIEGLKEDLNLFIDELENNPPILSRVIAVEKVEKNENGYTDFIIKKSESKYQKSTLISPDISICEDCLKELFNKNDKRFRYPFINCTNCGPRYTIIKDIPYDRANTSMHVFKMCSSCQKEYDNPSDRRFHAQPNGCFVCGPEIKLVDKYGKNITCSDIIFKTQELIDCGYIIAVKGLGGFHLCCDACNNEAVKKLRDRKRRYQKPLALMSPDFDSILKYAYLNEKEKAVLSSPQRPILLLDKKPFNNISSNVAPGINSFGVMLPYTPLHYLLLKNKFDALVMTSGNISEEPISIDNDEALFRLKNIADYFLLNNRDIYIRSDDSVVRIYPEKLMPLRRARGFVPIPIFLKKSYPQILACGGMLKNTFCFLKNNKAFLSQHIGDLDNLETLEFYEETIVHLKRILEIEPEVVVVDKHPDYISTRYGEELRNIELMKVQHHYAHIASCMAENGLTEEIIGIALDGTGYGDDGNIWGGEVFIANLKEYERVAHFEYMPLPGGDKAIVEPWRVGLSYLFKTFGGDLKNIKLDFLKEIEKKNQEVIISMIKKNINTPLTSSCGRLYDAVASISGIRNYIDYEGQAAIEFENLINSEDHNTDVYEYEFMEDEKVIIDIKPLIKDVVKDKLKKISPAVISLKFHNTLIKIFTDLCIKLRENHNLEKVALSGGCFQNIILLKNLKDSLERNRFKVYIHTLVPPNDGGISLGQAILAGEYYN